MLQLEKIDPLYSLTKEKESKQKKLHSSNLKCNLCKRKITLSSFPPMPESSQELEGERDARLSTGGHTLGSQGCLRSA